MSLCECGCGRETKSYLSKHVYRGCFSSWERRFINGHNQRGHKGLDAPNWKTGSTTRGGYKVVMVSDHPRADRHGYIPDHILLAEMAIGHILPLSAVVHHIDGVRNNNVNDNLVICENNTYHHLLHVRARALRESGDPHKRKCSICHQYDIPKNLTKYRQGPSFHKRCRNALWAAKKERTNG